MPHDVPDDEADRSVGQHDGVVPVAARRRVDLGQQVPRPHRHPGQDRHARGQQRGLQHGEIPIRPVRAVRGAVEAALVAVTRWHHAPFLPGGTIGSPWRVAPPQGVPTPERPKRSLGIPVKAALL